MHVKKGEGAFHEPRSAAVPAASCGGVSPPARTPGETPGELAGEDACATSAAQFMVPMHGSKAVGALHEPGSASILPAEESGRSSTDETSAAPCRRHRPTRLRFMFQMHAKKRKGALHEARSGRDEEALAALPEKMSLLTSVATAQGRNGPQQSGILSARAREFGDSFVIQYSAFPS
jgi:hypothetical protein